MRITELAPAEAPASEEAAAREILAGVKKWGVEVKASHATYAATIARDAAAKAYRYAQQHPEPEAFLREARRLILLKSVEEHEYKFPAAIFEDYRLVGPRWRPHMLAASVYFLRGSGLPDAPVIQRAREAVGAK